MYREPADARSDSDNKSHVPGRRNFLSIARTFSPPLKTEKRVCQSGIRGRAGLATTHRERKHRSLYGVALDQNHLNVGVQLHEFRDEEARWRIGEARETSGPLAEGFQRGLLVALLFRN